VSANRRQAAPAGPGWAHELKHDGYRLEWHSHLINMAATAIAQIDSKKKSTIPKDPIKDCARLKKVLMVKRSKIIIFRIR
jgi:hypothetical protein